VVSLEDARGLRLVEYARARSDELLVELPLVVAAVPPLPVQCFKAPSAFLDPVEGAHALACQPSSGELLHGAECSLRRRRAVVGLVCVVKVLEGEHGWVLAERRRGVFSMVRLKRHATVA